MLTAAAEWNLELLTLDAEALDMLWARRLEAWRSPDWTHFALEKLDERIAAHADALVLAADEADLLVEERLGSDHLPVALGAVHVLLCREDRAGVQSVANAFLAARGLSLEAFRIALRHAPVEPHLAMLERAAVGVSEPHALAALGALAFHGRLSQAGRLVDFVQAKDAAARRLAWEAVAHLGAEGLAAASGLTSLGACFRAGQADPDSTVRDAVLDAATWTRQPWLLETLRARLGAPAPTDLPYLQLLATLATPADVPRLKAAASDALGHGRLELLAALGHPSVVEEFVAALDSDVLALVAAAASAFRKVTGIDISTGERVPLHPEGDAEIDEAVLQEVRLPDPNLARSCWQTLSKRSRDVSRLCYGLDVSRTAPAELWDRVDLQTRYQQTLRMAFERRGGVRRANLERLSPRS
jgi:hypothetical protein